MFQSKASRRVAQNDNNIITRWCLCRYNRGELLCPAAHRTKLFSRQHTPASVVAMGTVLRRRCFDGTRQYGRLLFDCYERGLVMRVGERWWGCEAGAVRGIIRRHVFQPERAETLR